MESELDFQFEMERRVPSQHVALRKAAAKPRHAFHDRSIRVGNGTPRLDAILRPGNIAVVPNREGERVRPGMAERSIRFPSAAPRRQDARAAASAMRPRRHRRPRRRVLRMEPIAPTRRSRHQIIDVNQESSNIVARCQPPPLRTPLALRHSRLQATSAHRLRHRCSPIAAAVATEHPRPRDLINSTVKYLVPSHARWAATR